MPDDVARVASPPVQVRRKVTPDELFAVRDRAEEVAAVRVALLATVVLGFALRLVAALRLSPHVDEAASILAANVVSERLVPILPSGTVYFQGYPLSLLLAPLAWLGFADLDDLLLMRTIPLLAGTASIYLIYRLGSLVSGQQWFGVSLACLLALDPLSVQWSGHVRMYALLQLIAIGLAWVFIDIYTHGVTRKRGVVAIVLSWAAVFAHVGAALLLASIALVALLVHGHRIWRKPGLLSVLAASCLAPVVLLALNRLLGPPRIQREQVETPALAFVGESQVRPLGRFLNPTQEWSWEALLGPSVQFWLGPTMLVAAATLMSGWLFLHRWRSSTPRLLRVTVLYVLVTYWVTLFAFIFFTDTLAGRYLLHVHTPGYISVALVIATLVSRGWLKRDWRLCAGYLAVAGFAIIFVMASLFSRTMWRFDHPVMNPDYHEAMSFVAAHHVPGQPVIISLPPAGYLGLEGPARQDLYFLAGSDDSRRARDYSRLTEDGTRIDYWVGAETIVSADDLRLLLDESPDALLVIDTYRLTVDWAYGGDIEQVIREMTAPVYEGSGGVLVMGPKPADDQDTAVADQN